MPTGAKAAWFAVYNSIPKRIKKLGETRVKKSLAIILTILLTMALTCSAYAATGSFSDVPANHWAYSAVNKLVKAGMVDGYNGMFQGDRAITRYEMAIVVSKLLERYDSANDADKALIDKLSAEFSSELNKLGVRVAKVEKKTNTWVYGDARLRIAADNPETGNNSGLVKLKKTDAYDYRLRLNFKSELNDSVTMLAQIETNNGEKWGNLPNNTTYPTLSNTSYGSSVGVSLFNITARNVLGLDEFRVGRSYADFFTHGLWSKSFNEDGVRIIKKIGDTKFTGWTGRVAPNDTANGDVSQLTSAQLTVPVAKDTNLTGGYFWYDGVETRNNLNVNNFTRIKNNPAGNLFQSSEGYALGFDTRFAGLQVFGDFTGTTLNGAGAGLPTNPKAWWIEVTNAKKKPPVIYTSVGIVNPSNVGESAWMVAYRNIDAGAVPAGVGGFDNTAVVTTAGTNTLNLFSKNSDNVKGLFAVYSNVIAKNIVMSLECQDTYIKNRELTTLTSSHLDTSYQMRFDVYF